MSKHVQACLFLFTARFRHLRLHIRAHFDDGTTNRDAAAVASHQERISERGIKRCVKSFPLFVRSYKRPVMHLKRNCEKLLFRPTGLISAIDDLQFMAVALYWAVCYFVFGLGFAFCSI